MSSTMTTCLGNCTNMEIFNETITNEIWTLSWDIIANYFGYQPWIFSLIGSALVGLSGVFPLLIVDIDDTATSKHGAGAGTLKLLLSFAVGGLLGDVFLHLLPEAWSNTSLNANSTKDHPSILCGLWVLTGFLLFIITEKIFMGINGSTEDDSEDDVNNVKTEKIDAHETLIDDNPDGKKENYDLSIANKKINEQSGNFSKSLEISHNDKNGYIINSHTVNTERNGMIKLNYSDKIYKNGEMQRIQSSNSSEGSNSFNKNSILKIINNEDNGIDTLRLNGELNKNEKNLKNKNKVKSKHISGYLNLLANCIDNFTHGLTVGGSFLVSFRLGTLTTFAILIHEIPHEVGDFAILLKSGFTRWDAARAQLITATGGVFGALLAVLCSSSGVESRTSWILPFTAGGFLHIGLVTILPELQRESNPKESMKQLGALLSGIIIMAILTAISD